MLRVEDVNRLTKEEFIEEFGTIFEQSPWVANKAAELRPFASAKELHKTMCEIVRNSPEDEIIDLIRAHPNLGDKLEMSSESIQEQHGAGLQNLSRAEYDLFQSLNKRYMEKFRFPFILAVRGKSKDDIRTAMEDRVNHTRDIEFKMALTEIFKIALFRLEDKCPSVKKL